MPIAKVFDDGSYLEFKRGRFDAWGVFYKPVDEKGYMPHDQEYFGYFSELTNEFDKEFIYSAFLKIYDKTSKEIELSILNLIDDLSVDFGDHALQVQKYFTIMYMGMIAEENKRNTRLGKRIKRLGFYQVLILEIPVDEAANFSRGLKWREIDAICKKYGF